MATVKKKSGSKTDLQLALDVFTRTVLAAIMGFFVFMSFEMVFTGLFTDRIGYHVWQIDEQQNIVQDFGEMYYTDIDGVYKKLEELGYTVSSGTTAATTAGSAATATSPTDRPADGQNEIFIRTQTINSLLDPMLKTVSYVLSQICMFLIFASMLYMPLWETGGRDRNLVQFGHSTYDPLRGLRVGLLASIPALCGYIVLLLSKFGLLFPQFVTDYRFFHFAYFPLYLQLVPNEIKLTANLPWGSILCLLLFILSAPAITTLAYHLGYKQFSISEHLIYAKKSDKKRS